MKIKTVLIFATFGVLPMAHADLLSLYDFNLGSTTGTSAANAALLFTCNGGTLVNNSTMSSTTAIANIVSFTGTVTNQAASDASGAGAALALQGGTNNANNGTSLTMAFNSLSGTSLSNIGLSFAGQATSTGFNSLQLAYSVNGGSFVNFGSSFSLAPSSTSPSFTSGTANSAFIESFDLSSIGSKISSLSLQLTYTGATSATGNIRLDNIQLTGTTQAVPEPMSILALGLGVAGLALARRK